MTQRRSVDFHGKADVLGEYDVVVAGGGPAGFAAAVAAARLGMKALVVETQGCFGGIGTSGALPFWLGSLTGSLPLREKFAMEPALVDDRRSRANCVVEGIFTELVERLRKEHAVLGPGLMPQSERLSRLSCYDEYVFDMEAAKRVMDEVVQNSGADVLFFTTAMAPLVEDGRVRGVYLVNKDGLTFAEAKTVIDCTGDADIVHRAGYETLKGDKDTGHMNSVSVITHMENVDAEKVADYVVQGGDPWFRKQVAQAIETSGHHDFNETVLMWPMVQDGVFMINNGTYFTLVDGTSTRDLTDVMMRGRRRAKDLLDLLFRPLIPGFEHAEIRCTSAIAGVRETRRILGEYTLTEEDVLSGRRFEDEIAYSGRHFDLARPRKRPDGTYDIYQPFQERPVTLPRGLTPLPYRCLIPRGSRNVIAAGRCVSVEGQVLGPLRIMATCFAAGQAAGSAAALAVRSGVGFRDVDTLELLAVLRDNGAVVGL